jgi:hypothetical protein
MLESLTVLSSESVQKLRKAIAKDPGLSEQGLDSIAGQLSLSYVSSNYKIDTTIELENPEGISQEQNKDSENSARLLKFLPGLTPANATDERLWATLSFGLFSPYLKHRWPFRQNEEAKLSSHIKNHWFAAGVRGRMRDNGISRLWWMGYIAGKLPGFSTEQVCSILFANSDYRSTLLERNSSSNSVEVLSAILIITHLAYNQGIQYNRQSFRDFAMELNTLGGRRNLAAIDQQSLVDILTPIYMKHLTKTGLKQN